MCDQTGIGSFSQPLAVVWLIIFAANYAAVLSAAARVRAFNTSLMWQKTGACAAWVRFLAAFALLNAAPLTLGLLGAWWAGKWDHPTTSTVASFALAAFFPFAFWRGFVALCVGKNHTAHRFFKGDPMLNDPSSDLAKALAELSRYSKFQHLGGAAIYLALAGPLGVASILRCMQK